MGLIKNMYGKKTLLSIGGFNVNTDNQKITDIIMKHVEVRVIDENGAPQEGYLLRNWHKSALLSIGHLGNDIVMAQGGTIERDGSSGKDLFVWNFGTDSPKYVRQMEKERPWHSRVVMSGKLFSGCRGKLSCW